MDKQTISSVKRQALKVLHLVGDVPFKIQKAIHVKLKIL